MSAHYLNPVVPENFTNLGTVGDFSPRYERDFNEILVKPVHPLELLERLPR
jgi:hypothetical protein